MRARTKTTLQVNSVPMGFYCWDVPKNLVFGDANFARIYGLSPNDAVQGVSVELILSLIAEDDRGPLARYIHGVLLGEEPRTAHYTIVGSSGEEKSVCSIGSVIRDGDGLPAFYTGAVMSPPSEHGLMMGDLRERISDAIDIAETEGRDITRRYLASALGSLGA